MASRCLGARRSWHFDVVAYKLPAPEQYRVAESCVATGRLKETGLEGRSAVRNEGIQTTRGGEVERYVRNERGRT